MPDDPEPLWKPVAEWNLPREEIEFRAWLEQAGLTWEEFKELPAALNMPESLRLTMDLPR